MNLQHGQVTDAARLALLRREVAAVVTGEKNVIDAVVEMTDEIIVTVATDANGDVDQKIHETKTISSDHGDRIRRSGYGEKWSGV